MSNEQTGYFEIEAGDINTTDEVLIPKDKVGSAPSGEANPDQSAYDISTDGESHEYYIHIVNDTDQNGDFDVKGSHLFDEDFEDPDQLHSSKPASSGGGTTHFSGSENASRLAVGATFGTAPSSGSLVVVIQKASV